MDCLAADTSRIPHVLPTDRVIPGQSAWVPVSYIAMKPKAILCIFAALFLVNSAQSAVFTWDGGTGTWDTTTTNWSGVEWGNTTADEAVFGGTAGTVTINTGFGVTANKLTFNSDGYVVNGIDSADVLALAGTTPTAAVGTGLSATIDAVVAGSAGITKSGAGTLVLNGDNTYTGTTTLSGGTLVVGHANALSGTFTGSGASILRLATDESVSAFNLNSGTNNSYTVVADRATPGPALTHALGSSALGGGSSTITFQTGANVTSGTAAVSLTSLSLSAGITAGGSLSTTLNPTTATLTILGNVTRTGATTGSTKTLALSGSIAGNAIDGAINNGDADDVIAVTKSGNSTWTLNGTNSNYTGITTISAGALEVAGLANGGANSSIGASTNAAANLVFGSSGAVLRYVGTTDVTTDRGFTTSSGTGGGATIESSGTGALSLDNAVAIAFGTTNQTRTITLGGTNTGANSFSKVLANNGTSATSLTKNGTGTWTLDGTAANIFTGTTAINGGRLILAKTGAAAIGGNLTVGNAGVGLDYLQLNGSDQIADTSVATFNGSGSNAGIFQLNNQNETLGIASTGGAGIVENGNAAAGTSTLTVTVPTNTTRTFSGILQDNDGGGSGVLALTKSGSGTQVLTGTSTYTGVTTIGAGTLRFGSVTSLYNGVSANWTPANISVTSGAALGLGVGGAGEFTATEVTSLLTNLGALGGAVNNTGLRAGSISALDATNASGGSFTVAANLANSTGTGGGAFIVNKTGTNTLILSGTSTYTGATNIVAGALRVVSATALGSTAGNTTVQTNGLLELADNVTCGEPLSLQGNNTAASAERIVNVSGDNTLSGNIAPGPGGDKHGLRSDAGKLTIAGNIEGAASGNRFFYLRGDATGEITGNILAGIGNTSLLKEGTGTWTLSGANTYTGTTTVSAGTLHLAAGSFTSAITVSNGAFLGFTLGSTVTSTSTLTLDSGSAVKITGIPTLPSYTLFTAASPITGTPVLDAAIPGYSLVVDGNSLKLNAAGGSGFSTWITGTFANGNTVPGGQQGANDDPDKDGISNLVEYAVAGLDPTVSNGAVGALTGLTLTFTKRTPLATDISYIIETSPNLLNPWTAQVTHGPGNTDPTISYLLPSGGGKLFARLKVGK